MRNTCNNSNVPLFNQRNNVVYKQANTNRMSNNQYQPYHTSSQFPVVSHLDIGQSTFNKNSVDQSPHLIPPQNIGFNMQSIINFNSNKSSFPEQISTPQKTHSLADNFEGFQIFQV